MLYHKKMHYKAIFGKIEFWNLNMTVKYVTSQTDCHLLVSRVVRTFSEFQCIFYKEISNLFQRNFTYYKSNPSVPTLVFMLHFSCGWTSI